MKKITVSAPTTYVDLSGSKTLQLKATCDPEDAIADVTWSSSSSKIATVDWKRPGDGAQNRQSDHHCYGKGRQQGQGQHHPARRQRRTGLPSRATCSVAAGKSITLKAVMMPADATESCLVWSVDCDKSIASISQSGKLTTKKVSEITTITVTAVSQRTAIRATHTVTIRPVTGLAISAPRLIIDLASPTLQLTAKCIPEDASQQVAWSTSNKRIATVDANGLVMAKKVGKVTITAKATDGSGRSAGDHPDGRQRGRYAGNPRRKCRCAGQDHHAERRHHPRYGDEPEGYPGRWIAAKTLRPLTGMGA